MRPLPRLSAPGQDFPGKRGFSFAHTRRAEAHAGVSVSRFPNESDRVVPRHMFGLDRSIIRFFAAVPLPPASRLATSVARFWLRCVAKGLSSAFEPPTHKKCEGIASRCHSKFSAVYGRGSRVCRRSYLVLDLSLGILLLPPFASPRQPSDLIGVCRISAHVRSDQHFRSFVCHNGSVSVDENICLHAGSRSARPFREAIEPSQAV